MPNPKRRHSKSRRGKRRAHDFIVAPLVMACPQCKAPKEQHRVCGKCGYYNETQIFETEE